MLRLRRPSPALGVAVIALLGALGGTSFAAVSYVVPANSVGTKQLRDDSVTRAKIAHQSITSVLVKDGSLLAGDFAAGQLPAGPQGPAGPKGDKGETGVIGSITTLTASIGIPGSAKANDGMTVYMKPVLDASGNVIGYHARGGNDTGTDRTFTVYVLAYKP